MLFLLSALALASPSFLGISKCPQYPDIMDSKSLQGFNQTAYQGEWYVVADTEPTEPGSCHCDRVTWLFNPKKTDEFQSKLQSTCNIAGKSVPLNLGLSGQLAKDPQYPGLRSEGSPPLASWIPNMVLHVDRDPAVKTQTGYEYTTVLVYSCKENYLFHKVFESIQVFSRIPSPGDDKINGMLQKAQDLGLFIDPENLHIRQQGVGCNYPPSILPPGFVKS